MNVFALVVGVALVSQVATEGDRYAVPSQSDFTPAASSLTPLDQMPATTPATTPATPPAASQPAGSPQFGANQPPASGSTLRVAPQDNAADIVTPAQPPRDTSDVSVTKPNALAEPSALIKAMLTAPRDSRLAGQPVGLVDVVAGARTREEQTALVDAYWDLCSSVADYYLALQEQAELRRLRPLVSRVGPTWQQAESELAVRIGTAQRAAAATERRLASMMGAGEAGLLPLPADMPHCGDYRTRYEEIFANRPSGEAAELAELLPLRYEELRDAAGAVARAEEWLDVVAAQRSDNSDGTGMLRALELLALRRRAFVQMVRDYNQRIARYTELAAPGEVPSDVLVSMLIKTSRNASAAERVATPPASERTGRAPGNTAPATRSNDWAPAGSSRAQHESAKRENAVTPASAEVEDGQPRERRERSLLVPSSRR